MDKENLFGFGMSDASRRFKAELQVGTNGSGTKSSPVRIVARSGNAMLHPCWPLPIYHDFAGMKVAARIPLDYEHYEEIGYLNKFDTSSGDLVCKGAIVRIEGDDGAEVIDKANGGVPYQASIQWDDNYLAYIVADVEVATVNGQEIQGPAIIFREWTLLAVAVCKLGQDGNTSTELAAALAASKKSQSDKGLFVRVSKGNKDMNNKETKAAQTVEATTVASEVTDVEVVAEVATVEKIEEPKVETTEAKAEDVKVAEVVDAKDDAETSAVEPVEAEALVASKTDATATVVEAVDSRAEAKRFIATFGDAQGVKYFADGLSYNDATVAHIKHQSEEIADLQKRIASQDRGAASPLAFKDAASKAKEGSLIRLPGKSK